MAKKVTIFTTSACVYCKMAKEFLKENGIDYEEKDVASDIKAREEMVEKSHQLGVPVIDVDGEVIVGFDRGAISQALGL